MLMLSSTVSIKHEEENYMLFDNSNGNIYKINEVSHKILSLCDGENSNENIILSLTNEFDVAKADVKKDFNDLIKILLNKQYIYDNDN
ncbi:MAG TPA: PqqD family protein [bacterium]|nr:PqqD family protein [bacterium]